jgi:hypothetical protein
MLLIQQAPHGYVLMAATTKVPRGASMPLTTTPMTTSAIASWGTSVAFQDVTRSEVVEAEPRGCRANDATSIDSANGSLERPDPL